MHLPRLRGTADVRKLALGVVTAVAPVASLASVASVAAEGVGTAPAEHYVALGDSAAAGPVILPQQVGPPRCTRSQVNFPSLAAARIDAASFTDATCSSAKLDHLWQPQSIDVPPQLDAVTAKTTVVTLGPIGANDAGLFQVALSCSVPGCAERDADTVPAQVEAIRPEVEAALRAIKARAPRAKVVVVGYGQYTPPGGCPLTQPVTPADADFLQGLIDQVDEVLRESAAKAGAEFVDLRAIPDALDHTTCAPIGQRWFEGLVPSATDGSIVYHPTSLGMAAFATPVAEALARGRAQNAG